MNMARRKRIHGNLTPRMALEELGAVRDLKRHFEGRGWQTHERTIDRIERLLIDHVRAAVERAARRK